MKDLYDILNIPRNASAETIRKSFRKLAHQYHPDKNPDDPSGDLVFSQVVEAYQILSDPVRRKAYHEKKFATPIHRVLTFNAEQLQAEFGTWLRHLQAADPFRIDKDRVFFRLVSYLHPDQLKVFEEENPGNQLQILHLLFQLLSYTDYALQQKVMYRVLPCLRADVLKKAADRFARHEKRKYLIGKSKPFLALALALLLCLVIYFLR